jgi:hypothetical protein
MISRSKRGLRWVHRCRSSSIVNLDTREDCTKKKLYPGTCKLVFLQTETHITTLKNAVLLAVVIFFALDLQLPAIIRNYVLGELTLPHAYLNRVRTWYVSVCVHRLLCACRLLVCMHTCVALFNAESFGPKMVRKVVHAYATMFKRASSPALCQDSEAPNSLSMYSAASIFSLLRS